MSAYYNEFDPYAAEWLRNLISEGLIAPGDVDTRSIEDVSGSDLAGYTQVHLFAGVGGWSAALRLAGWPDGRPVWTEHDLAVDHRYEHHPDLGNRHGAVEPWGPSSWEAAEADLARP